jgi:uncharacterized protein YodC (DUF2158 family)
MQQLKVGDVVRLNSGGPELIVTEVHEKAVRVAWWNGNEIDAHIFPVQCVMKAARHDNAR